MKISFDIGGGGDDGTLTPITEIPLSILVVGDFAAAARARTTLSSAADLGVLLQKWSPMLRLKVDNLLGAGTLEIEHSVGAIKDLTPPRLIKSHPLLARTGALIVALHEAERKADPVAEVDRLVEQHADMTGLSDALAACARAARGEDDLDSGDQKAAVDEAPRQDSAPSEGGSGAGREGLLGMVDLPGEAEQRQVRARSAISSAVGAIAKGSRKVRKRNALRERIAEVVAVFSRQVDQLMHHEQFQRVEAAWRGLRLLVERTDFRRGARLEIMQATREELPSAVEQIEAHMRDEDVPVTCIVAPYLFSDPQKEVETLRALAALGESTQSPIISSLGAAFLGLPDGSRANTLEYPTTLLQKAEYEAWRELKADESGRWLSVVFNRFLLRAPYEVAVEGRLLYEEGIRADRDRLWGDPAWALASLIARSCRRYGWPTEITGTREGRVEDLAVRPYTRESGRTVDYVFEGRLTTDLSEELQRSGVAVFSAADNSDSAVLAAAPTVHGELGAPHHPLVYQLLVGRLAQIVGAFRHAAAGLSPDELAKGLERSLWQLIADTGVGAHCEVAVGQSNVAPVLEVYVRTGRGVARGAEVGFSFSLGAA